MTKLFLILFIIFSILLNFSCSINRNSSINLHEEVILKFMLYDAYSTTNLGPLLLFQDNYNNYIFISTESDLCFGLAEPGAKVIVDGPLSYVNTNGGGEDIEKHFSKEQINHERKLSNLSKDENYETLQLNKEYELKLTAIENIGEITITETMKPVSDYPLDKTTPEIIFEGEGGDIDIYKILQRTSKIYKCDQIYCDYILKSALINRIDN